MMYVNSNAEVIAEMLHRLGRPMLIAQYVIDRKARTITSDVTGQAWPIPNDLNLS